MLFLSLPSFLPLSLSLSLAAPHKDGDRMLFPDQLAAGKLEKEQGWVCVCVCLLRARLLYVYSWSRKFTYTLAKYIKTKFFTIPDI